MIWKIYKMIISFIIVGILQNYVRSSDPTKRPLYERFSRSYPNNIGTWNTHDGISSYGWDSDQPVDDCIHCSRLNSQNSIHYPPPSRETLPPWTPGTNNNNNNYWPPHHQMMMNPNQRVPPYEYRGNGYDNLSPEWNLRRAAGKKSKSHDDSSMKEWQLISTSMERRMGVSGTDRRSWNARNVYPVKVDEGIASTSTWDPNKSKTGGIVPGWLGGTIYSNTGGYEKNTDENNRYRNSGNRYEESYSSGGNRYNSPRDYGNRYTSSGGSGNRYSSSDSSSGNRYSSSDSNSGNRYRSSDSNSGNRYSSSDSSSGNRYSSSDSNSGNRYSSSGGSRYRPSSMEDYGSGGGNRYSNNKRPSDNIDETDSTYYRSSGSYRPHLHDDKRFKNYCMYHCMPFNKQPGLNNFKYMQGNMGNRKMDLNSQYLPPHSSQESITDLSGWTPYGSHDDRDPFYEEQWGSRKKIDDEFSNEFSKNDLEIRKGSYGESSNNKYPSNKINDEIEDLTNSKRGMDPFWYTAPHHNMNRRLSTPSLRILDEDSTISNRPDDNTEHGPIIQYNGHSGVGAATETGFGYKARKIKAN